MDWQKGHGLTSAQSFKCHSLVYWLNLITVTISYRILLILDRKFIDNHIAPCYTIWIRIKRELYWPASGIYLYLELVEYRLTFDE